MRRPIVPAVILAALLFGSIRVPWESQRRPISPRSWASPPISPPAPMPTERIVRRNRTRRRAGSCSVQYANLPFESAGRREDPRLGQVLCGLALGRGSSRPKGGALVDCRSARATIFRRVWS